MVGFGLVGAAPAAAAPFVYVADGEFQNENLSQFDAPLAGFQALKPLTPATVHTGSAPIAVAVSPDGNSAYVGSQDDSTVWQYTIDPSTGVLTPKSAAPTVYGLSDPVAVAVSPDGKNAYVVSEDAGVFQFSIDPRTGELGANPQFVAAGTNPVALALTPDGKSAYVANLLDNTVSQYSIDPSTGLLTPKSPATVATGRQPSGVAVTPDGKSAYVANEYDNTVSQYSIDPSTGALTPKSPATLAARGHPRGVAVTPDGRSAYLAGGPVSQYSIDPTTGKLSPKSPATIAAGSGPIAVAVTPDGKSAYVANEYDETVSQYSIDPSTGVLTPKSPASVAARNLPDALAVTPDANVSANVSAPSSVKSGSKLTYTIKAANAGPSSAWRVTLKDVLPYGTQFQAASATSGHCTAPKAGTKGGKVTCKLGKIKRGKSPEAHIAVKVTASANQGAIIDGATVSSVTPDPRRRNNKDHIHTKITK